MKTKETSLKWWVVSELEQTSCKLKEDKERLRRALIAYGVPIPAEGGTLAEWAELLEKERDRT